MNEQTTAEWPQQYSPAQRTSPQAIAVLVLGVASLTVFWGVAGIAALVLSRSAKREIAASNGAIGGEGLVRAGVICSWISIGLTVLAVLLIGLVFSSILIGGDTYTQHNPPMDVSVVP